MEELIKLSKESDYPSIRLMNKYRSLSDWQKEEFMNQVIELYEKVS